jgi:ribokinase
MASTGSGSVLVVGRAARDLVLRVDRLPESGGSTAVRERLELLGGKGANQAVGLRQLGAEVALLAVFGADEVGQRMLDQAVESGIDVTHCLRRGTTALLVDVVESGGARRLLEDVPPSALLTRADVEAAEPAFRAADTVCLQLQQPDDALLAAAELALEHRARLVLDGGIDGDARERLLGMADVVRADHAEATALTGIRIENRADAEFASRKLLARGPSIVALAVPGEGDLVGWPGGHALLPYGSDEVVDSTGAGDAFVAGLITGIRRGLRPEAAGRLGSLAAGATVARLGGRPDLTSLRTDSE